MLVNCVVYQDGRKLAEIQKREIRAYLERPDCFVWVALRDPDAAELAEMQDEFDLHELAVEDARHGNQRPKLEEYGDSLFAVLHTVEVAGDELAVGEVDVFVGRNYVLSSRQRTERGFQDVRARCEREPELLRHGSGYVLYALMDFIVDQYFPVVQALEDVTRIHPQAADEFEVGASKMWHDDEFAGGAFALFDPGQQTLLYDAIIQPEGRVHFAGEHASLAHAWIQGAIESGIRSAFVFPVAAEGRTVGVLGTFSRELREPDARLLAADDHQRGGALGAQREEDHQ